MKKTVLLLFLIAPCLSAGAINTAFATATCFPIDEEGSFGEPQTDTDTQSGIGSASAFASTYPCGNSAFAQVAGLDFTVRVDEGHLIFEYDGDSFIHGEAWYKITGGTGDALAYFDFQVAPLDGDNPSHAETNAGFFGGGGNLRGAFPFRFGKPFLLTVDADAHAVCCRQPPGYLSGEFGGLERATTLDGTVLPRAHLEELPDFQGVPEPSGLTLIALSTGVLWLFRRRRTT